jgi:dsDNA-specific endonuclease/ATPase MutS2
VQTRFGKGVVRAQRNNGRLLVEIAGRALVIPEAEISLLETRKPKTGSASPRSAAPAAPSSPRRPSPRDEVSVDLHGLTVEEAVSRAEQALDEALLADLAELRFIHGRSGGRIRAALHQRLRQIPTVRGFRLDPRNEGVTIVKL